MSIREPFIGSEALASGSLTRGQLRWNYEQLLPDVYLVKGEPTDLVTRARAVWLWTRRQGVIAGQAAAAIHTGKPIDADVPVEVITAARRVRDGIVIRAERIGRDEITTRRGMHVTTPARTALDLARFLPELEAIGHLDRLADATDVWPEDVAPLARRYRGARGIAGIMGVVGQMDDGAATPAESRLRLLLGSSGIPSPKTNILLGEWPDLVRISMGWPKFRVGVHVPEEPAPTEPILIALNAREAHRRATFGWLILTSGPERSEAEFIHAVHETLWEQVKRVRRPG